MLKVAIIEDDHRHLATNVANVLAFEGRNELQILPIWIKNQEIESERFELEIQAVLPQLKNKVGDIKEKTLLKEVIFENLDLGNATDREKIKVKLSEYKADLIFCDADMGLGGSENRSAGLILIEDISQKWDTEFWHCWIVSNYPQTDIARNLSPNLKFPLKEHYIDKRDVQGTETGKCELNLSKVLSNSLRRITHRKNKRIGEIVGISPQMQNVFDLIELYASLESSILIRGEEGTGKELVAKELHHLSRRKSKKKEKLNCGSLIGDGGRRTLFGTGQFTQVQPAPGLLEKAAGGTLFLDEIGNMPLEAQGEVLDLIEYKKFKRVGETLTRDADVRWISATNRNLEEAIKKGEFRSDLFSRLNEFTIELPPLRERSGDIKVLTEFFINELSTNVEYLATITDNALKILEGYAWRGNVRELRNCIRKAVIHHKNSVIDENNIAIQEIRKKTISSYPDSSNNSTYNKDDEIDFSKMDDAQEILQVVKSGRKRFVLSHWWKEDKPKARRVIKAFIREYGRYPEKPKNKDDEDLYRKYFDDNYNNFKKRINEDGMSLKSILESTPKSHF